MQTRTLQIKTLILKKFKDAKSELNFENNYQLLLAVMLSAQCLDARVNLITPALFSKYPNAQKLARAKLASVQMLIKSCNFYQNKSRNLIATAQAICEYHDGEVPLDFNALVALPGVGEKTANVVLAEACNANVMAVDTHIFRVAKRLGLSQATTPNNCAHELAALFKTDLAALHKALVLFGRYTCKARKPLCSGCFLAYLCPNKDCENAKK